MPWKRAVLLLPLVLSAGVLVGLHALCAHDPAPPAAGVARPVAAATALPEPRHPACAVCRAAELCGLRVTPFREVARFG